MANVSGYEAKSECEKVSDGQLAEINDKGTYDLILNVLHPAHNGMEFSLNNRYNNF